MILIGLTGAGRAGKDTVADYLVEHHGFTKLSFATHLKQVLSEMDPILGFDLYQTGRLIQLNEAIEKYTEDGVKTMFPAYRRYLQKLGTEGVRKLEPNFWVDQAMKSVDVDTQSGKYVFADVRFPNEAEAVYVNGGYLWEVIRDGSKPGSGHGQCEDHVSESWAGKLHEEYGIHNSSTIYNLHREAEFALYSVQRRERKAA